MEARREQLRTFIIGNFLFGDEEGLEDSTSFLDAGIIDSTGILEVISFIEESFPIRVQDEELVPENLDSINSILDFIDRKLAPAAS